MTHVEFISKSTQQVVKRVDFFKDETLDELLYWVEMLNAPVPRVAVENPAPMAIAGLPRYNQILQPYEFGHGFSKRVCLWLKNLPQLLPMRGYSHEHVQWLKHCAGNPRRRSKTFEGIAEAMAAQWGSLL